MRFVSATVKGPIVEIIRDQVLKDGTMDRNVHHIPVECLSIRAGEYGLDPIDDAETVLDMLLHELDEEAVPATEVVPPITTAPTLEEAREVVLARCRASRAALHGRAVKGRRPSKAEDVAHVEVLDSLPELFVQDRQLAELARIHMKAAVWAERERQAGPTISHKARMIDEIRQREGI